jgi:hypothetical protein
MDSSQQSSAQSMNSTPTSTYIIPNIKGVDPLSVGLTEDEFAELLMRLASELSESECHPSSDADANANANANGDAESDTESASAIEAAIKDADDDLAAQIGFLSMTTHTDMSPLICPVCMSNYGTLHNHSTRFVCDCGISFPLPVRVYIYICVCVCVYLYLM